MNDYNDYDEIDGNLCEAYDCDGHVDSDDDVDTTGWANLLADDESADCADMIACV